MHDFVNNCLPSISKYYSKKKEKKRRSLIFIVQNSICISSQGDAKASRKIPSFSNFFVFRFVGTGTNACYVEKTKNVECAIPGNYVPEKPYMLINIEWGAFGERGVLDFILTEFDRAIDENSINPTKQLFEKMISGMYMGELTRLVLEKVVNAGLLFGGKCPSDLKKRGKFFTKYVSEIEK